MTLVPFSRTGGGAIGPLITLRIDKIQQSVDLGISGRSFSLACGKRHQCRDKVLALGLAFGVDLRLHHELLRPKEVGTHGH